MYVHGYNTYMTHVGVCLYTLGRTAISTLHIRTHRILLIIMIMIMILLKIMIILIIIVMMMMMIMMMMMMIVIIMITIIIIIMMILITLLPGLRAAGSARTALYALGRSEPLQMHLYH